MRSPTGVEGCIPTLSIRERDRRYDLVREAMLRRHLDALIVRGLSSKWDSGSANVRYLTQIGGNGEDSYLVFPLKGEPTCFIYGSSQLEWWPQLQNWVRDVRLGHPGWVRPVVDRLRELGLERGRLGVVGLGGKNNAGGILSHEHWCALQTLLVEAELEPASDILEQTRLVKSDEEIAFITRAGEIGDRAIDALLEVLPGMRETEVFGRMMGAMLTAGGEHPMMLMLESSPAPRHPRRHATDRTLALGDMLTNEISPKYGGYWGHVHQPVSIGSPPDLYRRLYDACAEGFRRGLEATGPGVTTIEIAEAVNAPIRRAGYVWPRPQFGGQGLEQSEYPIYRDAPEPGDDAAFVTLRTGMVLAFQPMAMTPDGRHGMHVGDTVIVTAGGCRRCSRCPVEFLVI